VVEIIVVCIDYLIVIKRDRDTTFPFSTYTFIVNSDVDVELGPHVA
jgi:hypothetical protein